MVLTREYGKASNGANQKDQVIVLLESATHQSVNGYIAEFGSALDKKRGTI